jgi:hypothetical protein
MTAISIFDDFCSNFPVNVLPQDGEAMLYSNSFNELESKQLMNGLLKNIDQMLSRFN